MKASGGQGSLNRGAPLAAGAWPGRRRSPADSRRHVTAGVAKQANTSSVAEKCVRCGSVTDCPRHWPHMYTWPPCVLAADVCAEWQAAISITLESVKKNARYVFFTEAQAHHTRQIEVLCSEHLKEPKIQVTWTKPTGWSNSSGLRPSWVAPFSPEAHSGLGRVIHTVEENLGKRTSNQRK